MRAKTASAAKGSRPATKQRKTRDKGVISLKGPPGLPRTAKAKPGAQVELPVVTEATAEELKAIRLARIKERAARAKRPAPAPEGVEAPEPPVVKEPEPVAAIEVATVVEEVVPVAAIEEAPVAIEEAPVMEEVAPVAVVEEAPVVEEVAPVVAVESPPAVEIPPPVVEIPPPVEVAPAVTTLVAAPPAAMRPTAHLRGWSPQEARKRASTPIALVARVVAKLLRWGLRR